MLVVMQQEVAGVVHGDNQLGRNSFLDCLSCVAGVACAKVRVESKSEQANVGNGDLASMSAVNAVLENGGSVDAVTAGALMAHRPAWVGHHTGGSRSTPTVHPC